MSSVETYKKLLTKQKFVDMKEKYESNGEVTWTQFYTNMDNNKNKVVLIEDADFKNGTLRVRAPCMIKLTENISFNPNAPSTWLNDLDQEVDRENATKINPNRDLDWFPNNSVENNSQYFQPEVSFAYGLGFFAALTIESENVLINLNGFTLEQHKEHALQQRFYANIELADQPFIPFQGPSNFGLTLRTARNCWIFNGKIGLSSHHGIHGNQADNLFIEDVSFEDFEVAACALNGSKNVYFDNIVVIKNRRDVPVVGTYSSARFIKLFVKIIQDANLGVDLTGMNNASNILNQMNDHAFNSIIFGNGFNDLNIPDLFKNESGIIDGNAYGLLFNPNGIAVNSFLAARNSNKSNETTNICIENCCINGIHADVKEIIAIGNGLGKVQVDTAGAVLQFFNGVSNQVNNKYFYSGTALSDLQIEIAKIKTFLEENNNPKKIFGTLNIDKGIQVWKDDANSYFQLNNNKLQLFNKNNEPLLINDKPVIYEIFCNTDSMFHVNKGVIGFKIDGVCNLNINNSMISDVINYGNKGSLLNGNYKTSHPDQNKQIGYNGSQTYGLTLSAVNDVKINNLSVANIESTYSSGYGILIQNYSNNIILENVDINNVKSNVNETFDPNQSILPNIIPISRGISIDKDLFNIKIKNINVSNIINNKENPYNLSYDVKSNVNWS